MILCKTRKIFAVVFAAVIVLTFNACGDSSTPTNSYAPANPNLSVTENKNVSDKEYVTTIYGENFSGHYTGEWSNNMPNGEGTFKGTFQEEDLFASVSVTGTWVDGKLNGTAKLTANDKNEDEKEERDSTYEGEWKNGCLDGNNCKFVRKHKYAGQIYATEEQSGKFSQGLLTEGKQVVVSYDGNTYTYDGTFENGLIWNGTKHIDCNDGTKLDFNGSFSNGAMWNGTLTETLKNGTTRQTTVTNGEPEDKGILGNAWDGLKGFWDWTKPVTGPIADEIKDRFINGLFN